MKTLLSKKDEENSIEGERDTGSVNQGLGLRNRVTKLGGLVFATSVGLWWVWNSTGAAQAEKEQEKKPGPVRTTSEPKPLPKLQPDPTPAAPPPLATPVNYVQPGTGGAPAPVLTPAQLRQQQRETLLKRRLESPLSFDGDSAAGTSHGVAASAGDEPAAPLRLVAGAPAAAAKPGTGRAYVLQDPTLMIATGRRIRCVIPEAMDTTLPGPVTCIQSEDAYGEDNKVVLAPRNTRWIGRQAGGMVHGQRRVGVVWTLGQTPAPDFVQIPVDGGVADALGRPGLAGTVDNHFWERFGGAILVSLIDNAAPLIAATRGGGGNNSNTTISFPTVGGGAQEVVTDILKSTYDIPPTLTAPQAQEVFIYVAHPLDFRGVYHLEAVQP
jgi:type IV secretion system protein VirB10